MTFDFEYIEKITKLLDSSSLTEMILQDGEQVIELRKQVCAAPVIAAPALASTVTSTVASSAPVAPATVEEKIEAPASSGKPITSPMVGTFYSASSPTAKPFVQVGDTVSAGEVVCIIEAMKLMNEIESEVSGKITKICVENGQPVEYGQVLMYVE